MEAPFRVVGLCAGRERADARNRALLTARFVEGKRRACVRPAGCYGRPWRRGMDRNATIDEVVAFWRDAGPDRWFAKDEAFDEACRARFLLTHEAAARGDLDEWELR